MTNVTFYVYKLPDHIIGAPTTSLPDFIKENRAIVSLERNSSSKKPYRDNLCFFRCLALHKGHHRMALETAAKSSFRQYTKECISDFKGVPFSKLNDLEQLFEVNVVVYELAEVKIEDECNSENESEIEDDSSETQSNSPESSSVEVAGRIVRRSLDRYQSTMYLNLYENHFSYITDMDKYAKSYMCQKCQKLWKTSKQLNRHMGSCQGKGTCYRYPGGFYVTPKTIFEKLEEEGILVPEKERYYPYRAVFDFESYFDKSVQSSPTNMLTWDMKHVPVSVSICSNVSGYEDAVCFISDGSIQQLISDMMRYLLEISQTSYKYLEETFDWVLKELSFRIENLKQLPNDEEDKGKRMRVHLQKLQSEFVVYLQELLCLDSTVEVTTPILSSRIFTSFSRKMKRSSLWSNGTATTCVSRPNIWSSSMYATF